MRAEVFNHPPKDFKLEVEAAGCFCKVGDLFLLLKRAISRPQGGTWGIPGGKLERGESPRAAVIREVWEEVGIDIDSNDLEEIGKLYIRLPTLDYLFHIFWIGFSKIPTVNLNLEEHDETKWLTVQEALNLPLISGGVDAIKIYSSYFNKYI